MIRRSEAAIRAEILLKAVKEIKPTQLMYNTNVSWQPLMRYIEYLTEKGLMVELSTLNDRKRDRRTTTKLKTTRAGLEAVRDMNKYLPMFGLEPIRA